MKAPAMESAVTGISVSKRWAVAISATLLAPFAVGEAADQLTPDESPVITRLDSNKTGVNYDNNVLTLTTRGFGRPISCEIAEQLKPTAEIYGQVACLEYAKNNIRSDLMIDVMKNELVEDDPVDLVVYTQSAGAKIFLPTLVDFIGQNPNVILKGLVIDSAPENYSDIKYPAKTLTDLGPLVFGGDPLVAGIQFASLSITYPDKTFEENSNDSSYLASLMSLRGLKQQAEALKKPTPDLSDLKANGDPIVYILKPSDPGNDGLIHTDESSERWRQAFESAGITSSIHTVDTTVHAGIIHGTENSTAYQKVLSNLFGEIFEPTSE